MMWTRKGAADEHGDRRTLVDIAADRDLFDLSGFALDVEETIGVFTQVVTRNGLRERMRENVLNESVPV